ncbi:MAG: starch-binding protein [Oscillospiraceae bacterium]|nr:starch-binding protein [Oscillospiraceae bacterium]
MKKIISIVLSLILLVSLTAIFTPIASANPDVMLVIYVSVPDDWENPGFWAWGDEGNVFEAWPGEEFEPLPDNPGWFYVHVPAWADEGIVNANNGSIQTGNIEIGNEDIWVTVSGDGDDFEVTSDPQTQGDAPPFVSKYTVYARVPADWEDPHFWAWGSEGNAFEAWPGEPMTDAGDDWYKIRIPTWAINVIVNANDGSVQTENIEDMTGEDMWIIVEERDGENARANVSFSNPDHAGAPMVMIRAHVPASWGDDIRLWAWGSQGNLFDGWPGGALTKVGSWWEIEVEGWADNYIVNAENGSIQTEDMGGIETGVDVWFVIDSSGDFSIYYEEPIVLDTEDEPDPPPDPAPSPEASPDVDPNGDDDDNKESNNLLWILLGVGAGVIIIVVIVIVVIKGKK